MTIRLYEVVIDCADPQRLARWWIQATGYRLERDFDVWASIVGEGDREIRIGFQKVPEGKVVKNRVHLDLEVEDVDAEAERIEGLGATRRYVSEEPDDHFIVLADPEGNEFCIVAAD